MLFSFKKYIKPHYLLTISTHFEQKDAILYINKTEIIT